MVAALASAAAAERLELNRAAKAAGQPLRSGPVRPSPGRVIAEFTFGFWRYLTKSANEKRLWVPYLHHAYPVGTSRKSVDQQIAKLNDLRNRVAHHEPIGADLATRRHQDLLELAGLLSPELGQYILANTTCPARIAALTP